ncbi:DUF2834 domain-containing protein [Mycolicibacterium sp. XJ1819]
MTASEQAEGLRTSSKVLCAVYASIAIAAVVATWSQNLAYFDDANPLVAFFTDTKANPAARSITVDLFLFSLPVAIWMVAEARKHSVRFVWAYIVASAFTAVSITFPLFLIARELRLADSDKTRFRPFDLAALTVVGLVIAAMVIWVDVL